MTVKRPDKLALHGGHSGRLSLPAMIDRPLPPVVGELAGGDQILGHPRPIVESIHRQSDVVVVPRRALRPACLAPPKRLKSVSVRGLCVQIQAGGEVYLILVSRQSGVSVVGDAGNDVPMPAG